MHAENCMKYMDYNVAYLNGVETKDSTAWNCDSEVLLNNQEVLFKVDTGAEVTACNHRGCVESTWSEQDSVTR